MRFAAWIPGFIKTPGPMKSAGAIAAPVGAWSLGGAVPHDPTRLSNNITTSCATINSKGKEEEEGGRGAGRGTKRKGDQDEDEH